MFLKYYKNCFGLLLLVVSIFGFGCKKFVEIASPSTQIGTSDVFSNDPTATSAVLNIFSQFVANGFASGDGNSTTFLIGLTSDELNNYSNSVNRLPFYTNALTSTNSELAASFWTQPYNFIYQANNIIENLQSSPGVSSTVKQELVGEAEFIRAFCHFYLVNLFGDVPLITSTDYRINDTVRRQSVSNVYGQIVSDLLDAQNKLSGDYSFSSGQRTRPNKWAATAMLARTYLFMGDFPNAERQATATISNNNLFALNASIDSTFLMNSSEAIWQLVPNQSGRNTNEGNIFVLTNTPGDASLSNWVLSAFEPGDQRRIHWVDSINVSGVTYFFPYKYKVKTGTSIKEYSMVLRLAEQYLIRAEARAKQGNIIGPAGAIADVNVIRHRAGLSDYSGPTDQSSILSAILHERQVELFTEWGHRWFDLKRTNTIDNILSIEKSNWTSTDSLFPIIQSQIVNDPNMTQNPGYN